MSEVAMDNPICLVLNLSDLDWVKVFQEKLLPNEKVDAETKIWSIETKYYRAKVTLAQQVPDGQPPSQEARVEAWIAYVPVFEKCHLHKSIQFAKNWQNCDTKLLVTERISSSREKLMQFCLENGVELIDFSEEAEPLEHSDEDYDISHSQNHCIKSKRIAEALQTCMWSNMEQFPIKKGGQKNLILNDQKKSAPTLKDDNFDENLGTEEDCEEFEALFAKLAHFRTQSTNLNDAERKKMAEKVTMNFWKALGGDSEELGDLDCNSDSE